MSIGEFFLFVFIAMIIIDVILGVAGVLLNWDMGKLCTYREWWAHRPNVADPHRWENFKAQRKRERGL